MADVYATIAFYLKHKSEVEAYLQQRRQQAQEVRAINQAKFDPQSLRDRLLARKAEREAGLFRRNSMLDMVRVQDVGLLGSLLHD